MNCYLILGGTGLIGSALCRHLLAQGHQVIVMSRDRNKVKIQFDSKVLPIESLSEIHSEIVIDTVINLAGEPIADKPWTQKRKALIESSRITLTQTLVEWLAARKQKPKTLISGSAVGWYGDGRDVILTEQSGFNDEYTHRLCDKWEKKALQASQLGIRVCIIRTGLVLSAEGGILKKMLLPFKLGLGGKIGSGEQYMPWVHIDDMVALLDFLIANEQLRGIFNACSPNSVTNRVFTQTLAQALHRYALVPMPAWLLKALLGEMSCLLLTGQRTIPKRIIGSGFRFTHLELGLALNTLLTKN